MDVTESTNPGTITERTQVPLSAVITICTCLLGIVGTHYKLQSRIDGLESQLRAERTAGDVSQDRRIDAIEGDMKTIKAVTCALAGAQKIVVSGCNR